MRTSLAIKEQLLKEAKKLLDLKGKVELAYTRMSFLNKGEKMFLIKTSNF